jgi:hypothetical protein
MHAPYRYRIEIYRLSGPTKFVRLLDYAANSTYNDANMLAVIDAEMPVIEKRLDLWKAGDQLPVPDRMHSECKFLYLHHGIEWCDN